MHIVLKLHYLKRAFEYCSSLITISFFICLPPILLLQMVILRPLYEFLSFNGNITIVILNFSNAGYFFPLWRSGIVAFAFEYCSGAFGYCSFTFELCSFTFEYCSKKQPGVRALQFCIRVLQQISFAFEYCSNEYSPVGSFA